ncbi:hypothetical protein ACFQL7_17415 [Halocatena marina]|uniref:Transposase n=1 Tax=Halocatena marina TaxID=2934937 RepID=A0ABD5YXU7_9EURY
MCSGEPEYRNSRGYAGCIPSAQNRKQGESFSDTVERLAGERSLLDFTGILTNEAASHRWNTVR